jgi:SpoVK/Ycf46/Vps4 family AAA+-type ATPase
VLSPPQLQTLQSLATQLRQSPAVEVPQTGTITIFTGPDTSAKIVAAQTLAGNLHRDLYRIDLSAIVSKYADDTSNALTQLLHSAASGAILFFDEADALFGKRTHIKDSHDRYASQSTGDPNDGSLLQILQQYRGITILAISSMDDWNPAQLAHTHTTLKFPPTP